jgi:drug/metabolite transporter (DMT)-like permease
VIVLHEIVRWRRWSATAVGFIGVLVMVRPGAETFNVAALFALADSLSIAFLVTLIKRLPPGETPLGMMFYFGVFSTIAALPPALFVWQWPTTAEWGLLVFIGILGALSQSFWIRAYRAGEASIVAPFDYLRLLFAGIAGYLAFAETVDLWTVLGAAIIVVSTVYIARREARLPRAQAQARVAAKAAEEVR